MFSSILISFTVILIQVNYSYQQQCSQLPGKFINGNDLKGGQFLVSSFSDCCLRCSGNAR